MMRIGFRRQYVRLLPIIAISVLACSVPSAAERATMTLEARPRYPTLTPVPPASVSQPVVSTLVIASPTDAAPTLPVAPVVVPVVAPTEPSRPSPAPVLVAQTSPTALITQTPNTIADVDALIATMTRADKVGQLFMLGFSGGDPSAAQPQLTELRAGGIVLTTNVTSAAAALALTSSLRRNAGAAHLIPLLISVNHEGGDVQPVRAGMTTFLPQWDLGMEQPLSHAVVDACVRGNVQGQELARIGINMNLAPDLDVLDNPANTVIGHRAFSSDPQIVATLGTAYIEGLQHQGVLAVGKHFPGHGSSTEDSHQALPVILHDRAWLASHELVPFRAAIQANVAAIMVGHLSFPFVDSLPSSLSSAFVDGILRTELGYGGLVVTDDVGQMKAITAAYTPGDAAVMAIVAGSDMVLTVGPLQSEREMVKAVREAVPLIISEQRLDESVRRVMTAKMQAKLVDGNVPSLAPSASLCQSG
jgi:beta-N-acetylhexosaminidase